MLGIKARFLQKKRTEKVKGKKSVHTKDKKSLEEIRKKRPKIKKIVEVYEGITIKQLSERVNIPSNEMIGVLFGMGEILNINQSLTKDILEFLAHEYGFKYRIIGFEEKMEEFKRKVGTQITRSEVELLLKSLKLDKTDKISDGELRTISEIITDKDFDIE